MNAQSGLRLCCSHATKSGFLVTLQQGLPDIRLALSQADVQIYPISKPAKLTDKALFVHRLSCEGVT